MPSAYRSVYAIGICTMIAKTRATATHSKMHIPHNFRLNFYFPAKYEPFFLLQTEFYVRIK